MVDVASQGTVKVDVRAEGSGSVSKSATVSLRGVKLRTPSRALFLSTQPLAEGKVLVDSKFRGLNEIYRRLEPETVDSLDEDLDYQDRFQAKLVPQSLAELMRGELLLTVFSLERRTKKGGWESWIPTAKQLDYLANFLFGIPYNNIVVPPVIRGLSGENYLGFLERFFALVPSQRRAAVAGLVPNSPHRDLTDIFAFYRKLGLNAYVVDFQGKTPLSNWSLLPAFSAHLWKVREDIDPHYAHALNVRFGMKKDRAGIVTARDMLLLFECFDTFGPAHTPPPLSEEFRKKMAESDAIPSKPRLFDASLYGYYEPKSPRTEVRAAGQRLGMAPVFSEARCADQSSLAALSKVLNAAATISECRTVAEKVREGKDVSHLMSKRAALRDLPRIRQVKESYGPEPRDTKIDDWI